MEQRLVEVIADIALTAGHMIAERKISIDDSRTFVNSVLPELARKFETDLTFDLEAEGSYMEMVDEYAVKVLTELYGIDMVYVCSYCEHVHESPTDLCHGCLNYDCVELVEANYEDEDDETECADDSHCEICLTEVGEQNLTDGVCNMCK
jgi:hypothetical protein